MIVVAVNAFGRASAFSVGGDATVVTCFGGLAFNFGVFVAGSLNTDHGF